MIEAITIGSASTDHAVSGLAFAGEQATMLVVGAWSGSVTVLNVRDGWRSGGLRMRHGEHAVTVLPLGETDRSTLVATRSMAGLTRVWSVVSSTEPADPPVTSSCAVAIADTRVLLVAASVGQETVRCWTVDTVARRAEPLPDLSHPGAHTVTATRIGDRAWMVTAGETRTTLWDVTDVRNIRAEATFPDDRSDIEHVVLGSDPRIVLGTAGTEHLRLWTRDGEVLVEADDQPITAVAYEQVGDHLLIVAGDDDGRVHLIDSVSPAVRAVREGYATVSVALLITGDPTVITADHGGGLAVTPPMPIDAVPWQIRHVVTAPETRDRRLFGVADVPPRLLSWVLEGGRLCLDATTADLQGIPLHVARTGSAVADGGGQVLLVDADMAWTTALSLNVTVDALAGVPGTDMFVAARGGRLICVARSHR